MDAGRELETDIEGLCIELVPICALSEHKDNPNTHTAEDVDALIRLMTEFGFTEPLIIDDSNVILAGHRRFRALSKLGLFSAPCVRKVGLSDMQKLAYLAADNQSAATPAWDITKLRTNLYVLQSQGYDLTMTAFNPSQLGILMRPPEAAGPEETKSESTQDKDLRCQPQDIWDLGEHQLICGSQNLIECEELIKRWEKITKRKAVRNGEAG
jgi:hypothetical protein